MFLLPSNLSGSWLPPSTTLGIPLRSWQPFRSLQTMLEILVIFQRLDMRLFSVKADLSPPPQILETSEPEVLLQGVLEEAPELVLSVSIVASVVTFKSIVLLFEPFLICY